MLHSGGNASRGRCHSDRTARSPRAQLETLEQIYRRVFRQLRPRTPLPEVQVSSSRYASANAQIRLESGTLRMRLADTLEGAPASVMEALAEILLAKLFRRPVPPESNLRYRRYLNRRDIRRSLDVVRQIRGRKRVEGPAGQSATIWIRFSKN